MEHGRALELKKSPAYNLWEIVGIALKRKDFEAMMSEWLLQTILTKVRYC